MVVGGIGGEGVFEYLAARSETEVRKFDSDRVARLGPRGPLLNDAHIGADARITRFVGQRAALEACDTPGANEEKGQTMLILQNELTLAHWIAGYRWINCGGRGLSVYVSPRSGTETRNAAGALASVMHEALLSRKGEGPSVGVIPPGSTIPPEPSDPDIVVVLINGHP